MTKSKSELKRDRAEYMRIYRRTHREQIRPVARARYLKNREKYLAYSKAYKKKHGYDYAHRPEELRKQRIRWKTKTIYGKTPKGYERHHLNYDSPHNFILIPIMEHKRLHWKKNEPITKIGGKENK